MYEYKFCDLLNVFVTFDQFHAFLLNKSIYTYT